MVPCRLAAQDTVRKLPNFTIGIQWSVIDRGRKRQIIDAA